MLHFVFLLYDIHVQFLLPLAIIYVMCICDMIYLLYNYLFLNCLSYVSSAQTDLWPLVGTWQVWILWNSPLAGRYYLNFRGVTWFKISVSVLVSLLANDINSSTICHIASIDYDIGRYYRVNVVSGILKPDMILPIYIGISW